MTPFFLHTAFLVNHARFVAPIFVHEFFWPSQTIARQAFQRATKNAQKNAQNSRRNRAQIRAMTRAMTCAITQTTPEHLQDVRQNRCCCQHLSVLVLGNDSRYPHQSLRGNVFLGLCISLLALTQIRETPPGAFAS